MSEQLRTEQVGRLTLLSYLRGLWRYRHLGFHLAQADLQSRFRRSSLGFLWAMIHPLAFAMLYSVVLATLFEGDFAQLTIYVLSGVIIWEAMSGFLHLGSHSLINAAGYLKQAPIPMLIFPIRTCISIMFVFVLGLIAFALYSTAVWLFAGGEFPFSLLWFWAVPFFFALLMIGIPWATVAAFLNANFRDTQQVLLIATQAVWFSSPIFFDRQLFDSPQLSWWTAINPVVAFCDAFRDPMLNGVAPDAGDWISILCWVGISWVVAITMIFAGSHRTVFKI